MRYKIHIINLGSKRNRIIKELKEYIDGIGAKIQLFINDLSEEDEDHSLTTEEKLSETGDFILKLQEEIIEFRRK